MPCFLCDNTLKIRPCVHPTGIVNKEELDEIAKIRLTSEEVKIYIESIKNLHDKCPCIDCLVRVVCLNEKQTVTQSINSLCDEYKTLVHFKTTL